MKRAFAFIALGAFLLACEGKQGPMGPQGPPGPEGPSGATITYITGQVTAGHYNGPYIQVINVNLEGNEVTQVYLSPDHNIYSWMFMPLFEITDDIIWIYDPDRYYVGWDYMIMIIESSG